MKTSPIRKGWPLLTALTALALLVTACGGAAQNKIPIKLAENPWAGSSINVNVAKIILQKELGYEVEIVTIDENGQWPAIATGDISASLEVWPSGHAENIAQYIDDQKVVENAGELGVVGKIGWYVPTYVVEERPELATWEGFKDPANAALFATAETGELGQFLAGDPSYVQYDADIIKKYPTYGKVGEIMNKIEPDWKAARAPARAARAPDTANAPSLVRAGCTL